jgi:cysteine sulfinate desulfinase/cysteine desulfurase-like protein
MDNHATTPIDPRVLEAMPCFTEAASRKPQSSLRLGSAEVGR